MFGSRRVLLFLVLAVVTVVTNATGWGKEHFFQYANVPGWNQYEFGYHRGNDKHFTSRFEKAHGWTFKTKVRWGDKNGWGESYWDYNHNDKGHKKGWGHEQPKGWGHGHGHNQHGSYSENVPQVTPGGEYQTGEPAVAAMSRSDNYQQPQRYEPEEYARRPSAQYKNGQLRMRQ